MDEQKVKLKIVGITAGHANKGYYTLLLKQFNSQSRLPIVIGQFEAQSIALEIEGIRSDRPMSHDLMVDIFKSLGGKLKEVFIRDVKEGVFFATLAFEQNEKILEIDARTSDAIAISVRENTPIFTTQKVMDKAGIILEEENNENEKETGKVKDKEKSPSFSDTVNSLNNEELNHELNQALENEDYLRAAIIRDELKKRSK
tara:strand:- start:44 stop:646 length:603 start_codon:yes stop_codon:yes gene_type:complete